MTGEEDVEVHFIDRLPDNAEMYRKPLTKWQKIAKALQSKPRKWAVVDIKNTETKAKQVVSQIQNGYFRSMEKDEFEAASSFADSCWLVYARYVGKRRAPSARELTEYAGQSQGTLAGIRRHNQIAHSVAYNPQSAPTQAVAA